MAEITYVATKKHDYCMTAEALAMVEPKHDYEECAVDRQLCLTKIMSQFQDHLTERSTHFLGYPLNMNCNHLMDLSPLLRFHINNIGDPFKESTLGLHSKKFEVAVLDWFSQLWEIDKDEYWGIYHQWWNRSQSPGTVAGVSTNLSFLIYLYIRTYN